MCCVLTNPDDDASTQTPTSQSMRPAVRLPQHTPEETPRACFGNDDGCDVAGNSAIPHTASNGGGEISPRLNPSCPKCTPRASETRSLIDPRATQNMQRSVVCCARKWRRTAADVTLACVLLVHGSTPLRKVNSGDRSSPQGSSRSDHLQPPLCNLLCATPLCDTLVTRGSPIRQNETLEGKRKLIPGLVHVINA